MKSFLTKTRSIVVKYYIVVVFLQEQWYEKRRRFSYMMHFKFFFLREISYWKKLCMYRCRYNWDGQFFLFRYSVCFPWKTPCWSKLNAKLTNEKSLPDTCHSSGTRTFKYFATDCARLKSGLKVLPVLDSDCQKFNIPSVRDKFKTVIIRLVTNAIRYGYFEEVWRW